MKKPIITTTLHGRDVTFGFTLPEGASFAAMTNAMQRCLEEHLPKPPKPGDVTRNAYEAACCVARTAQDCWAAAESAARAGHVSKTEIRKALDEFNPCGAETVDVLGVVDEIRELVK